MNQIYNGHRLAKSVPNTIGPDPFLLPFLLPPFYSLKAARNKSDVLLSALFEVVPPVINVQEQTTVRYPESLYHSFVNTYDEEVTTRWRRDIPFIRAYRPRNTYYRGLYSDGDIQPRELPMHPEISVVSSVRLYFESPAAKRAKKEGSEDKE